MTPAQIETVKDSYHRIYPAQVQIAQSYFTELFRIAPSIRKHFPQGGKRQSVKLAETVGYLISHLDDMSMLATPIAQLAERHLAYGIKPEHFAPAGVAFLYALSKNMPTEVSETETDAWMAAFGMITDLMMDEMYLQLRAA